MASCTPRPHLRGRLLSVHGGLDLAELRRYGLSVSDVIDFSVNCNPYGPPPLVREAIARASVERYPDRFGESLRQALADDNGVTPEEVVVGNGSVDLIYLLCRVGLAEGDTVLIVGPTFGEYERASRAAGATVETIEASPPRFWPDLGAILAYLRRARPRLTFICNPNNPTGICLGRDEVQTLAEACYGLLIVDEAYMSFVEDGWSAASLLPRGNVVLVRSMTKDMALAGVRLGYALAAPAVVQAALNAQPPWSVNACAEAAGLAALQAREYAGRCRALVQAEVRRLQAAIQEMGWRVWPTAANYFLVDVGDAAALRELLLRRGVLVRDCSSFGLPRFVRIAARRPEEGDRLLAALAEVRHVA